MGAGGLPIPPRQRFQAQMAARQREGRRAELAAAGAVAADNHHVEVGPEGIPARPLDVQASLNELVGMLQRVMDFIPAGANSDGYDSTSSSGRET